PDLRCPHAGRPRVRARRVPGGGSRTRPPPRRDRVTAGPARSGWLPSIEGIRAVAVGLVLCSHLTGTRGFIPGSAATYQALGPLGNLGVRVFFVLSGFLITLLLLREEATTGRISLKRFWARRALRIFPAFYVFLIA